MQKTKRSVYNPDNYRKFQVFTEFEEDDLIDPDSLDEYRHFKQESSYILGIRKFTMEEEFSLRNQYPIVTQTNRGDLKVLSWESFEDYRTFVYSPQNKKPVIVPFRIDNSIYKFDYEFNFLSPRINKKVRDATYTIFACTLASEGINDIRFGDEFFIRQGIKWLEYYDNMGHLINP